jgi:replicative DNA helicase
VPKKGGGWLLKFTSTSMGLLDDVQRMLLRLGVVAVRGKPGRNSKSTRDIATIIVSDGDAILRFAETVDLRGRKAETLKRAVSYAQRRQRENARLDRFPLVVTEQVRQAANAGGWSWRTLGYRCQGKEMSREKLAVVAARLGRDDLAALAASDVLWDEIESIEPDGEEEVFDVCVPGMHNFVANGIFVHNSGAIEQDADTIIFIYRDDYYNPETSDLKGIAELIIAKQRNGPTGKVKVRFSASCTRFDNLEPGDYPETDDE